MWGSEDGIESQLLPSTVGSRWKSASGAQGEGVLPHGSTIFLAFVYLDEGSHIALAAVRSMEPRITLKYFFARGKG